MAALQVGDDGDHFVLHNGVRIPKLGFGCAFGNWTDRASGAFFGFQPEMGWKIVPAAVRAGYKLYDCALCYDSHRVVGTSIGMELAKGEKGREDFFLQSKVFHPAGGIALDRLGNTIDLVEFGADPSLDIQERVAHDIERCLHELSVGYLDVVLLHWPGQFNTDDEPTGRRLRKGAWAALEAAYQRGQIRAIGVSNFLVRHLETLLEDCTVPPMLNQIEVNPYITQADTVAFCKAKGILVQAWGPFGSGSTGVLQDPTITGIAAKHGKNAGQVILRWLVQHGCAALPKSSSEARMRGNLDIFDFALDDAEMAAITALNQGKSSVTTADSIA